MCEGVCSRADLKQLLDISYFIERDLDLGRRYDTLQKQDIAIHRCKQRRSGFAGRAYQV